MNIGQLADESGISAKMIRYYESIQLIEIPKRSVAGYRIYNQQDLAILKFIKHAKDLGFSIDHIRNLLKLWNNETRQSSEVKLIANEHIQHLKNQMRLTQMMIDQLESAVEQCQDNEHAECSILNTIQNGHE